MQRFQNPSQNDYYAISQILADARGGEIPSQALRRKLEREEHAKQGTLGESRWVELKI